MCGGKAVWFSVLLLGSALCEPEPEPMWPDTSPYPDRSAINQSPSSYPDGDESQIGALDSNEPAVRYRCGLSPPGKLIIRPGRIRFPPSPFVVRPGVFQPPAPGHIWVTPAKVQPPQLPPITVTPKPVIPPRPAPIYVRPPPVVVPLPRPITIRPPPCVVPRLPPMKIQPRPIQPPAPDVFIVQPPRIVVPGPPAIAFQPSPSNAYKTIGCASITIAGRRRPTSRSSEPYPDSSPMPYPVFTAEENSSPCSGTHQGSCSGCYKDLSSADLSQNPFSMPSPREEADSIPWLPESSPEPSPDRSRFA